MKTYKWNAKDYEQNSQAQQKWARELLNKLQLKGTEDVLDVGCGDGKVTAEISQLVLNGSVVGVDNSKTMIGLARDNHPGERYPNLSFRVMDASSLTFKSCFDVVFSNAALHWVKNHRPVVDGLHNCLKPGGQILLQMGGKGNADTIIAVLKEIQSSPEWQPYFNNFEFPYGFPGAEEYEELLLEAGFNVRRIELIPKDMEQEGRSGLEGWIRTTWLPYTERIPEEKRHKFIETISGKYIDRNPTDSGGKVHVPMVRLEIEAEK